MLNWATINNISAKDYQIRIYQSVSSIIITVTVEIYTYDYHIEHCF